jgi:hypothetical protein
MKNKATPPNVHNSLATESKDIKVEEMPRNSRNLFLKRLMTSKRIQINSCMN